MTAAFRWSVGALCLAWLASCSGEDLNEPALKAALAKTLQPDASGPGSLGVALPFDGARPHRLHASVVFTLTPAGEERRSLRIVCSVDRDGASYHVEDRRTWRDPVVAPKGRSDGWEAIFDGQQLTTRRRWGPWRKREVWRGDHIDTLRRAYALLPELLAAFEHGVEWRRGGQGSVAGLSGHWWSASRKRRPDIGRPRGSSEALKQHERDWPKWFAATHRLTSVKGRILRQGGADHPLAGELRLAGRARVDGRDLAFELELNYDVQALPADASFTVPKDALPARRERTWLMIRDVVRDALEPIYDRTGEGK